MLCAAGVPLGIPSAIGHRVLQVQAGVSPLGTGREVSSSPRDLLKKPPR